MSNLPPPPQPPQEPVTPLNYMAPAAALAPARPTSVTVIAIIVIVLSAYSLLCAPFGLIPLLMPVTTQQNPVASAMYGNTAFRTWTIVSVVIAWLVALANLIAAIQALRLQPWARRAMIRIAVVQLVLVVLTLVMNALLLFPLLLEMAKRDPAAKMGAVVGIVSGVLGTIIGAVLPSLTIYFFRRPKVVDAFEKPSPQPPGPTGTN